MKPDIHKELLARLKADFKFEDRTDWLRKGVCKKCGKKEAFTRKDKPWTIRCGREDKCGWEASVKELYPDIFDDWSKRYVRTDADPNAAADAYLSHARGFDLMGLRGAYSQEYYRDEKLGIGSATVRFPMPGGGYWERLIDQPGRFGKQKARFSFGVGYRGEWWAHPLDDLATLAAADQIWIVEGIFDGLALRPAGIKAVSGMSCNNYPEIALAKLAKACIDAGRSTRPKLIWAYDVGPAGVKYARKHVEQARAAGWECGAAQVRADGEGEKRDWNDLHQAGLLTPEHIAEYLWAGEVTIAETAVDKAFLIYSKDHYASFPMTFRTRQLWAEFSLDRINALVESYKDEPDLADLPYAEKWDKAARDAAEITELANCTFRALYFQRDEAVDESCYYFRVDFPTKQASIKSTFTGASIAAGAEFKKRLISIAPGAIWTGSTFQLDRLMHRQLSAIKTVEAIQFTGYSIDHGAWVLGDIGVHNGRVFDKNDDDYFDFGKASLKLRSSERLLKIKYDPEKLDTRWMKHLLTAYGAKGVVALAFWFGSLFAEHIRREQESLGFLEIIGMPGAGKTTLIEFLWKLFGREGHEGFDPAKATSAAISRHLGKVANLPVVFIEGDRSQDTPHARRFEWDELKTAYNGGSVRSRGVANGGMETFDPPFRGAIVISQNNAVDASPPILERIMQMEFNKQGWTPDTRKAAEALSATPGEQVSGFIIHAIRREADVMKRYREAYQQHRETLYADPAVSNDRLVKCHAQLLALLDALTIVTPLAQHIHDDAAQFIQNMAKQRQLAVGRDHPAVETFWERFDWIQQNQPAGTEHPINHSRSNDTIAVNLVQFEQKCGDYRLHHAPMNELKKLLKGSKSRKFVDAKPVNSITGKTIHCWCFENPPHLR